MYSFINYLFQVSVLSIVFLLLYHLAFRNQTRFHLNRSYLLSGLVLSWIIPLINIPFGIQIGTTLPQVASVLTPESIPPEPILSPGNVSAEMEYGSVVDSAKPFHWWVLYWVGAALVLLRNLWVLGRIIVLRHKNKSQKVLSARIISGSDIPAFSFFRWIFINRYQKLASYFRGSTLKKRMIMATKNDNRRSVWYYLLVIPLLALALMAFSYINDPLEFPSGIGEGKNDFVVLIDPAHGGEDPGSVNDSLGISEKDILLGIAKYLQKTAPKDLKIILTRKSDEFVSQDERIRMAANPEVDMIISLQLGKRSNPGIIASFFTSYSPLNAYSDQSKVLSAWFDEKYIFNSQSAYKTPQQIPDQILSKAECPGFLVNLGNFSNTNDLGYLSEPGNHKIIAENLHIAIEYVRQQIAVEFPEGQIEKFEAKKKYNSFMFPIKDEEIIRIASYYSKSRIHPILKIRRPHTGIDFSALMGTKVIASDIGTVRDIKINRTRSGHGTWVLIEHNNGWETFYAHLDECLVKKGDKIKRNQVIGTVGLTGFTVAPHLHFEIRKDGTPINPIHFLLPAYDKMEEIEIGTSGKKPKLKASEFFILEFIRTKKMVSNEFNGISKMSIEVVGKNYYLIVKGANSINNYAFELMKSKKRLFLASYNPSHSCRSAEEGLEAFKIENGEIIGCKNWE